MVNTRSNKERQESKDATEKKTLENRKISPVAEVDLETPEKSIDVDKKKTTESTPMPNAEE